MGTALGASVDPEGTPCKPPHENAGAWSQGIFSLCAWPWETLGLLIKQTWYNEQAYFSENHW